MNHFDAQLLTEEIIKYINGTFEGKEVNVDQALYKAANQKASDEVMDVDKDPRDSGIPPKIDLSKREDVQYLVDNEEVFPQKMIAQIKPILVDSILKNGVDLARNPFLRFLMYKDKLKNSGIQIPQAQGKIIAQACNNAEFKTFGSENLESAFLNKWWTNPKAYRGDPYKIQALILLTDNSRAEKFGDLKTRPLAEILDANSKKDVEDILTRWSAASGEKQERSSSFKKSPAAKSKVSDQEVWLKEVEDHYKAAGLTDTKKVLDAARRVWKKGKNAAQAWADLRAALAPADSGAKAVDTKADSGTPAA